jgi:hypothetical protein
MTTRAFACQGLLNIMLIIGVPGGRVVVGGGQGVVP